MAEFGYNLQDSTNNEFASSANYYSLAESRATTLNAGDTVTSLNCYANNNQAGSATISFYLYKADANGTPTDRVSGPHTLFIAGIENGYSVRTVGSLSISIPTTGKYTIVVNNDKGFRIARGASVETTSTATSAADPWVESSTQTWDLAIWGEYTAGGLTIDTIPTTINADSSFNVVVSNPATAPTTGNTTIKLTNASGQAATINSVTGTGPYTINATFPRASTDAFFASYALYVVVDAENATSGGTASYEPASGWSYVDVGTIDTSSEIYTQYSAGTIATGWQAVIKSPTNEDSVTVTMTDDLNYTFGPYTGSTNQTTEFYAINASQTVLAEETITFDFGGSAGLVGSVVRDIISSVIKSVVR